MNRLFRSINRRTDSEADIRDVTDLDSLIGRDVVDIYEEAFPVEERDPVEEIAEALLNPDLTSEIVHIRALVDAGQVVGFTYFASYPAYYLGFLKFIAIRRDIRGRGYGPVLLRDAMAQLRADGLRTTGWPLLGMVLEVERPEAAETEAERAVRERRIGFYQRNGAVMLDGIDYIAPPVAPGQPCIPFHLMFMRGVPKYGMQRWLRTKAVTALLVEGYGEAPDSSFIRRALEVRQRARGQRMLG